MTSKLDELCQELDLLALVSLAPWPLRKAIAVLRAFDNLAEYVEHGPACLYAEERGHTELDSILYTDCTCGVRAAQQAVADALEGK
jgi:hypothetical protein